jgi:3-phenylpropionate/trans-cinnamate dioxygenase ferredoxin reductase component
MAERRVDVLIVGGGVAGAACAAALPDGLDVLLAGREPDPPYQRPPVTKGYLRGVSGRDEALVPVGDGAEVLTRTSVMKLDVAARTALLSTKEEVAYGDVVLATGANVRRLPIDGADLEGIHYLRALRNADALRADVERAEDVVCIGGSFIGCEVAATLTQMGKRCTVVLQEAEPLALQFGERVGRWVRSVLEARGVRFVLGDTVERMEGAGEDVERVVCSSGLSLDAQAVVIGVGAVPDVMLARAAGLTLGERGGVACSSSLRALGADGVWAAGDVCQYESVVHGRAVRVEHHEHAVAQGRWVARCLAGEEAPFAVVPYFWSDLADWVTLESVGPAVDGWDDEQVDGSLDDGSFTVWYRRDGRVVQALVVGDRPGALDEARSLIAGDAAAA